MSRLIDLSQATPDQRVEVLGEPFREIKVLSLQVCDGATMLTRISLEGREIVLVGDPVQAFFLHCAKNYPMLVVKELLRRRLEKILCGGRAAVRRAWAWVVAA